MYVDTLLADGFVRIEGAIDPELCESVVQGRFRAEGWGDDAASWPVGPVHLPATATFPLAEVAPRAVEVLEELVGGVAAARFSDIPDNLIVNFPNPTHAPQSPTQRAADPDGWHKDGDWFRHFLDSPEQGLLGIVLWRDVVDGQGPTCIAPGSMTPVAELLASRPDGIDPTELKDPIGQILGRCTDIRSVTGTQGTILFAHPFLVHAASVNTSSTPRVISNTSVMLREPMRFDRSDDAFTDVERATLRLLSVDRLDFRPTGSRQKVVSEREKRWADETNGAR